MHVNKNTHNQTQFTFQFYYKQNHIQFNTRSHSNFTINKITFSLPHSQLKPKHTPTLLTISTQEALNRNTKSITKQNQN